MTSCAANQSLFQLTFEKEFKDALPDNATISWDLRYSSSAAELQSYYGIARNATDVSECLPDDGCYRVDTSYLVPEAFTVTLGGQVFEPTLLPEPYTWKKSIPTTTEFGLGCVPNCGDGASLFELEIAQGDDPDILWQLEDSNGSIVYERGDVDYNSWHRYKVFNWRKCLPSDDCYSFTIATRYDGITIYADPPTNYTVKWDGKTVKEGSGKNLTFTDTTRFGGNCQAVCTNGTSFFEAFVLEDALSYTRSPNLAWTLNDARNGEVILSGSVADSVTNSSLHRAHMCVPASLMCLSFLIELPVEDVAERSNTVHYSVRLGDVFYRNNDVVFRKYDPDWASLPQMTNETTFLGDSCTSDLLCSKDGGKSLLEVGLITDNEGPYLALHQLFWFVGYENGTNLPDEYKTSSTSFVDYYMSSTQYKALHCLPKDECIFFAIDQNNGAAEYSVLYDGAIHDQRTSHTDEWSSGDPWAHTITTPLGCPTTASSLSAGAIAGIVIGSVAFVFFAALAVLHIRKKREANGHECEEENERQNGAEEQT